MFNSRMYIIIALNLLIVVSEVAFGIISNSLALVADALHNLTDVASLIISFIAIYYAGKKADFNMTFGYVRAEFMAGFINSLFLFVSMLFLIYESCVKLINPQSVDGIKISIVAAIALAANLLSAYLLKDESGFSHNHAGHNHAGDDHDDELEKREDLNIKSAMLHLLSDAAISLAIVFGGLASYYWKLNWIDPALALTFSIYISFASYKLLAETFYGLMDSNSIDTEKIIKLFLTHDEILSVHDLHIISPSSKDVFFSIHIVLKENHDLPSIENLIGKIREELKTVGITHSVLQPETVNCHTDNILCESH